MYTYYLVLCARYCYGLWAVVWNKEVEVANQLLCSSSVCWLQYVQLVLVVLCRSTQYYYTTTSIGMQRCRAASCERSKCILYVAVASCLLLHQQRLHLKQLHMTYNIYIYHDIMQLLVVGQYQYQQQKQQYQYYCIVYSISIVLVCIYNTYY